MKYLVVLVSVIASFCLFSCAPINAGADNLGEWIEDGITDNIHDPIVEIGNELDGDHIQYGITDPPVIKEAS